MQSTAEGLRPAGEVLSYTSIGALPTDPIALSLIGLIFIQLLFVTMA